MNINRRNFLVGTGSAVGALMAVPYISHAQSNPIRLGMLLDTSGPFSAYGIPMEKASQLAVESINEGGGLLGRQVEIVFRDTQSDMANYTTFANQMVRQGLDVFHGGILSASREAIRQTLRQREIPYFYNVLYEGGVCDGNTFVTGTTPAQQVEALIPHAMNAYGAKKLYVLAANYNYGQITAAWVKRYAEQNGATDVEVEFFDLSDGDFGPAAIAKIQESGSELVVSVLVGAAQLSFYSEWLGSGMLANPDAHLISTTFGVGNEHKVLPAVQSNGMLVANNWAPQNESAENKAFLEAWTAKHGNTDDIHEIAVSQYQGILLWAHAVEQAGSVERSAITKVLESGASIVGPSGRVEMDPATHHCKLDIHVVEIQDQQMNIVKSFAQREPVDTQSVCNLTENPDSNVQYEITL
ncbi:MAG: ABC transporter substrate-binding protein [Gammaproteobacteria bacterium]|nr:ABC transporter substrate-binding protein [Gammaproteobacteria bacterium]